jgi:hypothetical protein
VQIQVSGHRDLFSFATALREAGAKGLSAELNRGLRDAAQVVIREIERTTDDYMPSGYEGVFASSLKLKPEVRVVSSHRITIVGVGVSRAKGRDVEKLNAGILRKPVFGRYRTLKNGSAKKNPWAAQRIRAGWFSNPFERSRPAVLREIDAAVARVVKKIERA